ncbi:MAG: hypothetical protein KF752_00740 [Pirellulaceae bacterium]|nr:hypothetical protein [Pirellulaceae bacterium]
MEDLQVHGSALVTSIDDCPEIAAGDGSVVTARFCTREVHTVACVEILGTDGQIQAITGTTIHPIWSEDRQDWVALGELEIGETLRSADGSAQVLSITIHNQPTAVYNIEVHGQHVYQVGEIALLVHNTCSGDLVNLGKKNAELRKELIDARNKLDELQGLLPTNAIDSLGFDEFKQLRIQTLKDGIVAMESQVAQNLTEIDNLLRVLGL